MTRRKSNTIAEGICPACKQKTRGHLEDFGFAYEYGSIKSSTHDYVAVSNYCNEPMKDYETYEIDPEPDDYFERRYSR